MLCIFSYQGDVRRAFLYFIREFSYGGKKCFIAFFFFNVDKVVVIKLCEKTGEEMISNPTVYNFCFHFFLVFFYAHNHIHVGRNASNFFLL